MVEPDPLAAAIKALRTNQPEEAIAALSIALESNLPDALAARATSLRAQAKLMSGDLGASMVDWREAWRQVLALGDTHGQEALKGLRAQIAQARAQKSAEQVHRDRARQSLAEDLDAKLEGTSSLEDRLNLLVERANALMDCDQPREGLKIALQALLEADTAKPPSVRTQVLARLCALRAQPEKGPEFLEKALALADEAEEPQLIGAVARAANALSYDFQAIEF
jgi:hypothetical protein